MNKGTFKKEYLAIIIMGIIILAGAGVYSYNYIQEQAYQQGITDTNLFLNQRIRGQIDSQGFITFNYQTEEGFYPVNLIDERRLK